MKFSALTYVAATCAMIGCGRSSAKTHKESGGDADLPRTAEPTLQTDDSLARRADSLIRAGRPWRATVILAPVLRTLERATPELRLVGARAASEWEGWNEVERLLRGQPWLDREYNGSGRELLARSMLELGVSAMPDARLALIDATDEGSRVIRQVILARVHDRANTRDSAAAHYLAAAAKLPRVADWLKLRAAGVTTDSAARAPLLSRIALPVARARVLATDAQARERGGDFTGAAAAFRRGGDEPSALRVESLSARDDVARRALAGRILVFLQKPASPSDSRQALEILDKLGETGIDQLALARAVASTVPARAVTAFTRASAAQSLVAADRMAQASALSRTNRAGEAARIYATITDDVTLAPVAAYQRARMQLQSGDGATARTALRAVATEYAANHNAAAPALLLLADLQVDDNDLKGASQSLHELIAKHPQATQAPLARFRAGLLAWNESPASAAAAFDSLAMLFPNDEETLPAKYWAARSLDRAGREADAATRFRAITVASPLSYYAMRSAERLKTKGWTIPAASDSATKNAAVDSAVQRVMILRRLGMEVEARFELDALAERAERTPAEARAVAQALSDAGDPARALRVALAAIDKGQAAPSLYRLAFPVVHIETLRSEAERNALDPFLVAGLIRQESSWNPRAVSPANARGLMQLLPAVGASIANAKQYPTWNTVLLFQPDVNIELGTTHLASSVRKDVPMERTLAAYNAGASRVARWINRPGSADPELFTEWIPYTETRDYVRIVMRNAAIYRALY